MVGTFGASTTSVGVGMQSQVSQPGQMQPNQQQAQQTQVSRYFLFVLVATGEKSTIKSFKC